MNKNAGKLLEAIGVALARETGVDSVPRQTGPVRGGQINHSMVISHDGARYFIKLNSLAQKSMFEAEMKGLLEMAGTSTIRVPAPLFCGDDGVTAFLIMEYLDLVHHGNTAALGEQLAALHEVPHDRFGWDCDNTIGLTPQVNTFSRDWLSFWSECRLGFQLRLAEQNGYGATLQSQGQKLLGSMHHFFDNYQPAPALIHGDLWSGNYAYTTGGDPVIYDPAVYYGDREADLAMTELFGGFSSEFYAAYNMTCPLDPGYGIRKHLYNLYHVLNHLNLFGGAYLSQAESMINRLLAESG